MRLLRFLAVVAVLALLLTGAPGVRAADTITLRGSVLLPDGQPAPNARVFLSFYGVNAWVQTEIPADAAGRFSLDAATTDKKNPAAMALALQPGFAAAWSKLSPPEAVVLQLGVNPVPFTGAITGPDGQPVPGAEVAVWRISYGASPWMTLAGARGWRATTGPDGRFSFPDLPATGVVEYSVHAPGLSAARDSWALAKGNLAVALALGYSVTGRVLVNDKPVPGVFVEATDGDHTDAAATGADGTFTIGGLLPGSVVLHVTNPPAGVCSSVRVVTTAAAGQDLAGQDLVLTPGALLSGKVTVAATGAPVHDEVTVAWAPVGAVAGMPGALRPGGPPSPSRLPGALVRFYANLGPDGTYQLRVPAGEALVLVLLGPAYNVSDPPQRRLDVVEGGTYPHLDFTLATSKG